jgi:hypothetical protein
MLVFVIPLKSPEVSKSWERVSKLLERTLKSVCHQTSSEFRVIVVCHQKPEIEFTHPYLTYIEVDFPLPKHKNRIVRGLTDKGRKVLKGLMYGSKFNPSHAMLVDSDDCVSKRLAEFVKKNSEANGWYLNKGYKYLEGDKFIYIKRNKFYTLSGTANIVKYQLLDLPQEPEYNHGYGYYKFYLDHQKVKDTLLKKGFPLKPLPFAGSIYILATGDNMSGNEDNLLFNWFNRKHLNPKITKEFYLYNLD